MKKLYTFLISLLFTGSIFSQEVTVKYTSTVPEIDGYIESTWDAATPVAIAKSFMEERATVTATWQALYDENNFYVLVVVEDDNHWPGWEAEGDSWLYDKPEVYWDVNEVLKDGGGVSTSPGHWQLADGFTDGMYDMPINKAGGATVNPGGTYAYSLVDEGYVYEMAVPWTNLTDNTGATYDTNKRREIGFDVTIIDQDEGITTSRQRTGWMNNGDTDDENWNNMDGAGTIQIGLGGDYGPMGWYLWPTSHSVTLSSNEGSTESITVHTYMYWTVVSDQSWLVVSPSSHEGDGTLTFTASGNTGATRTATVTISWEWMETMTQVITITQEAGGAGVSKFKKEGIRIYPNPANDRITIQGGIERVELFNSEGIKVKELKINKGIFSVGDLPLGVYLLKAYRNGDFAGVTKIFKN
jgi:hypothetical protein